MSSHDEGAAVLDKVMTEVLDAHRALLSADDVPAAVDGILQKVGAAAQVDRAYVFETHTAESGAVLASQRYEWAADGIVPQINNPNLQRIPLRESGYGRWLDEFSAQRPIHGAVAGFPAAEQPTLYAQGIHSVLILPIFTGGQLWGFVGFDDCSAEREWTESELNLLLGLTITLSQVFPDGQMSPGDNAAVACMRLVAAMLGVQAATLTETPIESLSDRTRARLKATVETHRFFSEHSSAEDVELGELFHALQPHFPVIRAGDPNGPHEVNPSINVESISLHPVTLDVERALDLVMIVTEVLAVLAEHSDRVADAAYVGIGISQYARRIELTITARDLEGAPIPPPEPLDGMAFLMIRYFAQRLNASQHLAKIDGMLFRLSFPWRA